MCSPQFRLTAKELPGRLPEAQQSHHARGRGRKGVVKVRQHPGDGQEPSRRLGDAPQIQSGAIQHPSGHEGHHDEQVAQ